jgi:CubicO group peptidase (beta-lactamase class C family)
MTVRKTRALALFCLLAGGVTADSLAQIPDPTYPGAAWEVRTPVELGMDEAKLNEARAYAEARFGAGIITRNGYQVASWGQITDRYPIFSVTKGIGAVLLGVANAKPEFNVQLTDKAQTLYPAFGTPPITNTPDEIAAITIEQLATHSAGFEKSRFNPRIETVPGTSFQYSDGGANWLADVLTFKMNEDMRSVLDREVLQPLGIQLRTAAGQTGDFEWRDINPDVTVNPRGTHIGAIPRREFNSGISANVDAMARIGLLLERDGAWNGVQILSPSYIARLSTPAPSLAGLPVIDDDGAPDPAYPNASAHHGLFWWNNGDGTLPNVPRDAYWAWGLGDHLIVVIPSLNIVVARTSSMAPTGEGRLEENPWTDDPACRATMCAHYEVLDAFLTPIVASVQASGGNLAPTVNAGADVAITLPTLEATLTGTATDDGQPSGSSVTTTWSVVSGDGVTIASPNALSTAVTFPAAGTYTLRLTATDGALSASDDIVVTVNPAGGPVAPTVTLTPSAASVAAGTAVTLTWSSTNADSCTASNGWTGTKATSGTENVTVSANATFVLDCTGPGGTTQATTAVSVTQTPPPPPPADDDDGGGGGVIQWWLLAALLLSGAARALRRSGWQRRVLTA